MIEPYYSQIMGKIEKLENRVSGLNAVNLLLFILVGMEAIAILVLLFNSAI
jgi:hypothetical protein